MERQSMAYGEPVNETEQKVLTALRKGRRAQCEGGRIRASFLRGLILRPLPTPEGGRPQPTGISLHGAVIEGTLDLEGSDIAMPVMFFGCRFGRPGQNRAALTLRDARLRRLGLYECVIYGGIAGEGMEVASNMFMRGAVIQGAVRLRGARFGGAFTMEAARIEADGPAMTLDYVTIDGPWVLRDARIRGAVRLHGARISGGVLAENADFLNPAGPALRMDGARIEGALILSRARFFGCFRLRGARINGLVMNNVIMNDRQVAIDADGVEISDGWELSHAAIRGMVLCRHALIRGIWLVLASRLSCSDHDKNRYALHADLIEIKGNAIFRKSGFNGQICAPGMRVDGQLVFTDASITAAPLAIRADGSKIEGGLYMSRARINGLIRLPAAVIGNQMRLSGAQLRVDYGSALMARGVQVRRDIELNKGFSARGAIVLDQAVVQGTIDLTVSALRSARLMRARLRRDSARSVSVTGGVMVHGRERHPDPDAAQNDPKAFSFVDGQASRLVMPQTADARPEGILDLTSARLGALADYAAAWPRPSRPVAEGASPTSRPGQLPERLVPDYLVLDGLTYEHLENPGGGSTVHNPAALSAQAIYQSRKRWLLAQSPEDLYTHFKPQPWLHLADRLRQQGHERDANQLMISWRRALRQSASLRGWGRVQNLLLDVLARYGYNPWRTIAWMTGGVLLFSLIWLGAARHCSVQGCHNDQVFVRSMTGNFSLPATSPSSSAQQMGLARRYPAFNPLAYSFDLFIPLIDFGYQGYWRPNTEFYPLFTIALPGWFDWNSWLAPRRSAPLHITITMGWVLYSLMVIEMILGLLLTSIAITGFTGLLRSHHAGSQ